MIAVALLLLPPLLAADGGGGGGACGRAPAAPAAAAAGAAPAGLRLEHGLFDADAGLVAGLRYQVVLTRHAPGPAVDVLLSSWRGERPAGEFEGPSGGPCDRNAFRAPLGAEQLRVNWTLDDAAAADDANVTFRVDYGGGGEAGTQRAEHEVSVARGACQLFLRPPSATVSHGELPRAPAGCRVWFPQRAGAAGRGSGLLVQLLRLNVPCGRGYVAFAGGDDDAGNRLCGKLEELPEADRGVYYPSLHPPPSMEVSGNPVFTVTYRLVDHCYNVTYSARNGSVEVRPKGPLQCTFRIYLPYGNRVALRLTIGDANAKDVPQPPIALQDFKNGSPHCQGLLTTLHDGPATWQHCTKPGDVERQVEIVSRENGVVLRVRSEALDGSQDSLTLRLYYRAEAVPEIVGPCEFGWVALGQFCATALEEKRDTWTGAELRCQKRGGHLLSVKGEEEQQVVDRLLLNRSGGFFLTIFCCC